MADTGGKAPGEGDTKSKPATATLDKPATKPSDPAALQAVIAEVEKSGSLDESARGQLLDDLRKTDPALWPQIAQVFRASLAYREQLAQREANQDRPADDAEPSEHTPKLAVPRAVASKTKPPARTQRRDNDDPPEEIILAAGEDGDEPLPKPAASKPPRRLPAAAAAKKPLPPTSDPVTPATYAEPVAADSPKLDWKQHVNRAAAQLEAETSAADPAVPSAAAQQAALRLLQLAAGRREDAVRPIPGIPSPQQEFWSQQLYALGVWLDTERTPDSGRRAAEAGNYLRQAQGRLNELAPLVVRNLTFCKEVQSYGVYKKFDSYEFRAGQELLLYAEVENFFSKSTDKGYHTALKTSYQILDSRGQTLDTQEFAVTEECCQNARRDFFVRYFITLPKRIFNGQYSLKATIEDTNGHKIGQSSVEFSIKEK